MTSRERALAIFAHEEADRVPIDYWASEETTNALLAHFGLTEYDQLLERLHVDFRWPMPLYKGMNTVDEEGHSVNIWGVKRGGDFYGGALNHPLADAKTVDDIENYNWPNPDDFDYSNIGPLCAKYQEQGYCILGGSWAPTMAECTELVGDENFYVMLYENQEMAKALIGKVEGFYFEQHRRIFEAANGKIDVAFMGDDYGTQTDLIMSIPMLREFFGPGRKALIQLAADYGCPSMLHSCGSVRKMIPELLDWGFAALNPIQPRATGMDPYEIKAEFGEKMVLHGSICTQYTLPAGTKNEVIAEVKERIDKMAPGGGFCVAPSQWLLPDIPIENIIAMYDFAFEYGEKFYSSRK